MKSSRSRTLTICGARYIVTVPHRSGMHGIASGAVRIGSTSRKLLLIAATIIAISNIPAQAQDVVNERGVHRDIAEYADGTTLWDRQSMNTDLLDQREHLRTIKESGKDQKELIATLSKLGACLDYDGDFLNAQRYHQEALEVAQRVLPEKSAGIAAALHNRGVNYEHLKQYDDALKMYGKALDIWQAQTPADPSTVALEYFAIGRSFAANKSDEAAVSSYKKALANAIKADHTRLRIEILQELNLLLTRMHSPEFDTYFKQLGELIETPIMARPATHKGKDEPDRRPAY